MSSGEQVLGGGGGEEKSPKTLMFSPFSSLVSTTFWSKFNQFKIDVLKLNEDPVPICGFYAPNDIPNIHPVLSVDNTSFDRECKPHFGSVKVPGLLLTTTTFEKFRELDYNEVMRSTGQKLLGDLFSADGLERIAENPTVLASFFILTHPNFKKFKFFFWFGFPAINLPSVEIIDSEPFQLASTVFHNFEDGLKKMLKDAAEIISKGFFVIESTDPTSGLAKVKSLTELGQSNLSTTWFGFLDTSTHDDSPSWVLRNYLAFIILKLQLPTGSKVNLFSYRPGRLTASDKSCVFSVLIQRGADLSVGNIKVVGWERNDKGAFGPKTVDVHNSLNPEKLAENSVDLNLKLMKWRLFPDFDLEMMHKTKCLILGAGTLGCNVARCLMGWGVRNVTFADNGHVSYSNPARQSLYVFKDCENGGKEKAATAAENLKLIFPGINTKHAKLMIPMAGHPTSNSTIDQVRKDYETLTKLIEECDVMFLLMDTRESRWLPTVLGKKYGKIVINAALGYDSYVVMRHGMSSSDEQENNKRPLGCYFCTDVVAPGDSTKDRTLDQQCTVTRPGVSMIASALAVEMMTAILHHPKKGLASSDTSEAGPLGFIPHTIRGFLCSYEQITPSFQSFDKCTACSPTVLQAINERGFEFVLDVLNNPSAFLEKLTGLDKLKDDNQWVDEIIELSDEDEA